jgi:hypothetical protein
VSDEVHCPKDLLEWSNSDSAIQWFLYDANLLPEQIDTEKKVCALRGFQFGWEAAMKSVENKTANQPTKQI